MAEPIYVRSGQPLTPEDEQKIRARLGATAAPEPSIKSMREQVAAGLRAEEERMAAEDPLGGAAPADVSSALRARDATPALPQGIKLAPGQDGGIDMGKITGPQVPKDYKTPASAIPGSQIQGSDSPHNAGGRALLSAVSGGATEDVLNAEAGAVDQAKGEVTERGLSGISAEEKIRAFMAATGATQQQAQQFVRVNPSWQPASRTAAQGASGMDPQSRDDMMTLQKGSEIQREEGMLQAQDAQANQGRMLLEVQNNKLKAEEAFRRDQDSIQQRYDTERAEQMAKLQAIQTEMEELGKQPRTIREWLDTSGTGTRLTYGLAAGLSAIGGAMGRRGNQPLQDLFNRTQASINAKVDQEKEAFSRLGERAKLNDTVYARIRQAAGDDHAALNVTKAMYYDAIGTMVEQIATQYQLDMQSPQLLDFMAKLAKERQALIGETATKLQEQSSRTDRFNPGGVFAVGGAGSGKRSPDRAQLMEDMKYYSERADKLKVPGKEKSVKFLTRALENMQKAGVTDDDEKFWSAFVAMTSGGSAGQDSFAVRDARKLVMALPPEKQAIIQDVLQSGQEQMSDEAGKALTGNELALQIAKKGGFSINGLRKVRDQLAEARDRDLASIDTVFDPDPSGGSTVGNLYRDRVLWAQTTRPDPILNTNPYPAITPGEKKVRDGAKLR